MKRVLTAEEIDEVMDELVKAGLENASAKLLASGQLDEMLGSRVIASITTSMLKVKPAEDTEEFLGVLLASVHLAMEIAYTIGVRDMQVSVSGGEYKHYGV